LIRKIIITASAAALIIFSYSLAFASGNHEGLACTGCHDIHAAKGPIIFAVEANKVAKSPKSNTAFSGVTALCLGCHAAPENGGMGIKPISQHTTHPFGEKPDPKIARVPRSLLRDGKMDCVSCHDPHPSNPNYRYLRTDTKGGAEMQFFCAICHPAKADSKTSKTAAQSSKIFTSMDEVKGATTESLAAASSESSGSSGSTKSTKSKKK